MEQIIKKDDAFFIYCILLRQDISNWMGDQKRNDCLVVYIEKDVVDSIDKSIYISLLRFLGKLTQKILIFLV